MASPSHLHHAVFLQVNAKAGDMLLLDHFAGLAMQEYLRAEHDHGLDDFDPTQHDIARSAYALARAMMDVRDYVTATMNLEAMGEHSPERNTHPG